MILSLTLRVTSVALHIRNDIHTQNQTLPYGHGACCTDDELAPKTVLADEATTGNAERRIAHGVRDPPQGERPTPLSDGKQVPNCKQT